MGINRRDFVKSSVLSGLALAYHAQASVPLAGGVTGRVFLEGPSGGTGLAGMLVSDGVHFAVTDGEGRYHLKVQKGNPSVFVHQTKDYQARTWFHNLSQGLSSYDFAMHRAPAFHGSFVAVADSETQYMDSWLPNMRRLVSSRRADFALHCGDLCYLHGIRAHAQHFTASTFGVPAYVAVGNHDIIRPVKGENYNTHFGPNYYSFEWGPYLMVSAPMSYGDIPLPYDMLDFGDYLEQLFKLVGKKPLIMLCHDLLGCTGERKIIRGHHGLQVELNRHDLRCWVFGHWHDNMAIRFADGCVSYCTAPPNKGGIQHSPSCSRLVEVNEGGKLDSLLVWSGFQDYLNITVPAQDMIPATDEVLPISVVAYDSGELVGHVHAVLRGEGVVRETDLTSNNRLTWNGMVKLPRGARGGSFTLTVTARKQGGGTFAKSTSFRWTPRPAVQGPVRGQWHNLLGNAEHTALVDRSAEHASLQWMAQMPGENYISSPVLSEGRLLVGLMDDHMSLKGGVYAYDAATGTLLWRFICGYSVKNSLAIGEGKVFFQDARGITYGLSVQDGHCVWKQSTPHTGLPGILTGSVYSDGVVYAGSDRSLAAFEASSGKVLWRNKVRLGDGAINTPAVQDGILITSGVWRGLYGMDAKTGRILWKHKDNDLRFQAATVSFHEGKAYAKGLYSLVELEPRTGRKLRVKTLKMSLESGAAPVVAKGLLLVGSPRNGMCAFDFKTLEPRWQCSAIKPAILDTGAYQWRARTVESSPVVFGDTVWVGANDGHLYALDVETGKVRQKLDFGTPMLTSVAAGEGWLFASDFGGRVFGLDVNRG